MLSPVLLDTLRQYWRHTKPKKWLFPGVTPDQPISGNDVFVVFHNAVRRAGITKQVCSHSLRKASSCRVGMAICIAPESTNHITGIRTMVASESALAANCQLGFLSDAFRGGAMNRRGSKRKS